MTNLELVEQRFGKDKIKELKKQNGGKLKAVIVGDKYALLRMPTLENTAEYSLILNSGAENLSKALVDATRYLLEELWVDGDNEIRDNDEYTSGAMMQIQQMIEVKKTTVFDL